MGDYQLEALGHLQDAWVIINWRHLGISRTHGFDYYVLEAVSGQLIAKG